MIIYMLYGFTRKFSDNFLVANIVKILKYISKITDGKTKITHGTLRSQSKILLINNKATIQTRCPTTLS